MTETVQLALIATITPTLASLITIYVSMKSAKKIDVIDNKTTEIHTSTNGTLNTITKKLEVANAEIEGLKALIVSQVESKKTADSIALATATIDPEPVK